MIVLINECWGLWLKNQQPGRFIHQAKMYPPDAPFCAFFANVCIELSSTSSVNVFVNVNVSGGVFSESNVLSEVNVSAFE